jgi:hypothetical protein
MTFIGTVPLVLIVRENALYFNLCYIIKGSMYRGLFYRGILCPIF